jgi:hypothetical protein
MASSSNSVTLFVLEPKWSDIGIEVSDEVSGNHNSAEFSVDPGKFNNSAQLHHFSTIP